MSVKKIARRAAKRAARARDQAAREAAELAAANAPTYETRIDRMLARREAAVERQIVKEFGEADEDLLELAEQFKTLYVENERRMDVLRRWGQISDRQYDLFVTTTIIRSEEFERMARAAAMFVNRAGISSAEFVNDCLPWFFSQEANYTAYLIEGVTGKSSFALIDEQAVRRLALRRPQLLPTVSHNTAKTTSWVEQKLRHEITAGIIRGESVDELAARFESVTKLPRAACVTNARTAINGARNGGRQESLDRADAAGLLVEKMWRSTLDYRTRDSHQHLDGEKVDVDDRFSNGLLYPGDMRGRPEELYNCRCSLRTVVNGIDPETRRDNITGDVIGYVTYDEWKKQKMAEAAAALDVRG
jgi:hypothetical protein